MINNDSVTIEEEELLKELTNIILVGQLISSIIIFVSIVYWLSKGIILFSLIVLLADVILVNSIIRAIELTATKTVKVLGEKVVVEYIKFNKVLFDKKFTKKEIVNCKVIKVESSFVASKSYSIAFILNNNNKKLIIFNVSKEKAFDYADQVRGVLFPLASNDEVLEIKEADFLNYNV